MSWPLEFSYYRHTVSKSSVISRRFLIYVADNIIRDNHYDEVSKIEFYEDNDNYVFIIEVYGGPNQRLDI